MTSTKPICSLSLDLDNQWSYMKTHGDNGWESFPSYLGLVVPRILKVLDDFGWKITFFVVGQDAALEKNREALQMIAAAGHEIGNHSFKHEPWLHLYSEQQVEDEIVSAEEAVRDSIDVIPRGFRGPGYSLSRATLEVLSRREYLYDASTFPTYIGPLARAYYFMTTSFSRNEKDKRKALFGGFRDGLRPIAPYRWDLGHRQLLEIPVTTMPVLKLPIHFSYLFYISTFSVALAVFYFKSALGLCRATRNNPSLLLHPLDFLGCEDLSELAFFPAMNLESSRKLALLFKFFRVLASRYTVLPMAEYSRTPYCCNTLTMRPPELSINL